MSTNDTTIGRSRRVIGNILIFLLGLLLVASAGAKFTHVPKVIEQMGLMGLEGRRLTFVAFLEVGSAVLLLFPVTRSAGLLLASSFMGGAIATHLEHGQAIIQPSMFLALLWLGVWLRHPQIQWSWGTSAAPSSHPAQ
jgi:ABC-type Na+ efflux pump permease subunit